LTVEIREGWIRGELPGPNGPVEVVMAPRDDLKPWSRLVKDPPNLCLHTTEGSTTLGDAYERWEFPPNFACGDGHIVQLFPLGFASEGVDTKDGFLLQVELAFRVGEGNGGLGSATKIYLPPPSTLDPLVALVAFLHEEGLITTGLRRPNPDWPVSLDKLPAAVDDYYRRTDGTWPKAGVYGHVEIPDDEHYDPASFDYPTFFEMVRDVLKGDDLTPEQEEALSRMTTFLEALTVELGDQTPDMNEIDAATPTGAAKRVAKTVLKAESE
jgi:hypothetical protein